MKKVKKMSESQLMNHNLVKVAKQLEKANSFKLLFIRGIIMGVGTAIGATIIAGIVIAMLVKFLNVAESFPILNDLLKQSNIQEMIESSRK